MALTRILLPVGIVVCAIGVASAQVAGPVIVQATDNIYAAGQSTTPGQSGGTLPQGIIPITAGDQCLTIHKVKGSIVKDCGSAEGCITLDGKRNLNDPDGVGGQLTESSNTGTSLISGIKAPDEGYLVGVFLPAGGPAGPAPKRRNYTLGKGTAFRKLAPELDQVFFVGDGRSMDGMGARQHFVVPAEATSVVLGISDTCDNGNGAPGCYFDNEGTFKVRYELSTEPCK